MIEITEGSTASVTIKVVIDLDDGTADDAGFYGVQLDNYFITTNADGTTGAVEIDVLGEDIETDQEYIGL